MARLFHASAHHDRMCRIFGLTDRKPYDDTMIRISTAMRHLDRIDSFALPVGVGDSIAICNPDLTMRHDDAMFRELAALRLLGINSKGVQ